MVLFIIALIVNIAFYALLYYAFQGLKHLIGEDKTAMIFGTIFALFAGTSIILGLYYTIKAIVS